MKAPKINKKIFVEKELNYGAERSEGPIPIGEDDNWKLRPFGLLCRTCMYYAPKLGLLNPGRCRRHAPTTSGWPIVSSTDWCGDYKLYDNKV